MVHRRVIRPSRTWHLESDVRLYETSTQAHYEYLGSINWTDCTRESSNLVFAAMVRGVLSRWWRPDIHVVEVFAAKLEKHMEKWANDILVNKRYLLQIIKSQCPSNVSKWCQMQQRNRRASSSRRIFMSTCVPTNESINFLLCSSKDFEDMCGRRNLSRNCFKNDTCWWSGYST